MRLNFTPIKALLMLLIFVNCKTANSTMNNQNVIRQAENTPEEFSAPANVSLDGQSCKNPMVDSRDGTKITLLSSSNGVGKYQVPIGTYGVKKGEALLLDCSTGKVKGIVKI
ncbi:hypothetical protein M0G43_08975 [Subsaxibacter sp. CAU 1640]|uniref:hypothetical protein n=1 Tax=Subsaxibacter sp. CAU 1640 TaxID=2933271 RepID=UPI002003030B|nr:hypothetical protein [Subsaxibacter sp. CAU 1640]MCK7590705.1 hypothetical protein [Subsaxibacter sp. CAU 1640]